MYWESASISPITDSKGTITHFAAIKEDITEHKLAERRLDAQHTVIQILALSPDLQDAVTNHFKGTGKRGDGGISPHTACP